MSQPLIEAKELAHSFDYPLYDAIDITLYAGQSMAIVGRSGSGKSTLLHTLSSFLRPDLGSVQLLGRDIYSLSDDDIELLRRDDVGIIFQGHYLFKGMTGRENIETASLLAGESMDDTLLQELEIAGVIDQKIGDLSGGQQQRVSIARVLNKHPRIIFADEPTSNIDNNAVHMVMTMFHRFKDEGHTLIIVSHDPLMAEPADQLLRLEKGRLVQ